ncbi:dipeptide ABC transporter ATP-binding protein [Paenibacillus thiaminolyticus]|uniref:Dipeptide ABC transporter ATP-binding protein n=1 Tax=Paenibacillus thiaminolyticus TaxID=49283 RepID=A0AAP9DXA2_PANTH|nr:dipeptide ABC transporter ATP-binding protein [Paenibacillus thiaminolyticus]MCY9538900.1 dipeptide ABC transporter ATP-binding protein [Paenibacillus thiaminolyticus]MCY9605525.1 dipeptide ABC transporter ATP-binding protein [Paenibacillus thiaminolyticus]MCY9609902.1 dipeptide ABC transporter ATP-binding protein [Paenibacillus thiaminolyticus]MCY9613846.1 dipeptide ABC transporter ATP-binding protein [Paenibacillus thiaminolyticus]MCY9620748.1 dipeptide ABC transporter ATP-binding protein
MTALLQVRNLKKHYPIRKGLLNKQVGSVKSVDGLNFDIYEGETFGIVGESGCGKSTTGRSVLRLIEPTEGEVLFQGRNLMALSPKELRQLRPEMSMIFQDPYASLDPRWTVQRILEEPLQTHLSMRSPERKQRVQELMERVGLSAFQANRFPHEFSGGQRQRVGIARALALNPKFIVCDEPVSALDVSIQSQVLNLMQDLQEQEKLTYMFISHDLSVVKFLCTRVGVMYLGKMVELAPKRKLYANPLHPYTKALMSAVPVPNPKAKKERIVLSGEVPSAKNPPQGCAFHLRCPIASERCRTVQPEWQEADEGHWVACHHI